MKTALFLLAVIILLSFASLSIGKQKTTPTNGQTNANVHWVGTWSASQQMSRPASFSRVGFAQQTVRLIIHPHIDGKVLRIKLSNTFGKDAVTFGQVRVALSSHGASIIHGTSQLVTFNGHASVTLPRGTEMLSDPIAFTVSSECDLAVSLYLPEASGPTTWHAMSNQLTYISTTGNHTNNTTGSAFKTKVFGWYWLSSVEVQAKPSTQGAIVTLGDSITDGYRSTPNMNHRWPDFLAERLNRAYPGQPFSVLNAGISGNRILRSSTSHGVDAIDRLNRDVLSQAGVTDVILLEGINDIGKQPHTYDANKIIAGMKTIIKKVHAQGLRIYGGTLTPFQGKIGGYYTPQGEVTRETVNHWIRTSKAFDGVIDFDKALRDPNNPHRLRPKYDSGDHLHPNDAGYQAMANAVHLSMLIGKH